MAYAKVKVFEDTGTTPALTGVAAGNLLVLEIHTFDDTTTISSITDDKSNTWTIHGISSATNTTGERVTIASAYNAAAGNTNVTITRNTGTVGMRYFFYEFSGFGASDPFQSVASADNAGSTSLTFNLSAVPAGALVVGGFSGRASTYTPGANYTKQNEYASNWYQYSQYDLAAIAGGTVAFDATSVSGAKWTGIAAAFHAASPPASTPLRPWFF